MTRQRVTVADDGVTLIIAPEILRAIGVQSGDEMDIAIVDRTVILRPLDEVERAQKIDAVTQAVIKRRRESLQQLKDS